MTRHVIGTSSDLAEIDIDYKTKKVKFLRGNDGQSYSKNARPTVSSFAISLVLTVLVIMFFHAPIFDSTDNPYVNRFVIILIFAMFWTANWLVAFLFPEVGKTVHYLYQKVANDYLSDKKVVIVDKLDTNVYKLPIEFRNIKLDYYCYGDFKKYLTRVHIKPQDYYIKSGKSITRQVKDWEAYFYFTSIPKTGRMEIEFI